MKEIITYYNILEEYFMMESSKKVGTNLPLGTFRQSSLISPGKSQQDFHMVDNIFRPQARGHRALSATNSTPVT